MWGLSIGVFLSMRSKWEDFILFFFRLEAYSSTNTIAIQKPIARIDRGRAPESGYMLESGIGSIYAELCTSACFGTEPSGYGPRNQFLNQIFTKSPYTARVDNTIVRPVCMHCLWYQIYSLTVCTLYTVPVYPDGWLWPSDRIRGSRKFSGSIRGERRAPSSRPLLTGWLAGFRHASGSL